MAWRLQKYLIKSELDNTKPDKVTGWMEFLGMEEKVVFDLDGNFHRDIRGAKIELSNDKYLEQEEQQAKEYFDGFSEVQKGSVGDMTAGVGEGADYVNSGYIEWYSANNGRVVIELDSDKIKLLSQPIPVIESDPVDRGEQQQNMDNFLRDITKTFSKNDKKIQE